MYSKVLQNFTTLLTYLDFLSFCVKQVQVLSWILETVLTLTLKGPVAMCTSALYTGFPRHCAAP